MLEEPLRRSHAGVRASLHGLTSSSSRARSTSSFICSTSASTESKATIPRSRSTKLDLDLDAVQLEVGAVQHVALDAAVALAVERRVGADADRGRVALAGVEHGAASRRTHRPAGPR